MQGKYLTGIIFSVQKNINVAAGKNFTNSYVQLNYISLQLANIFFWLKNKIKEQN